MYAGVAAISAAVAWVIVAALVPPSRRSLPALLDERAPLLAFLALLVLLGCAGVVRWLAARYLRPLRALAEQARLVGSANPQHRVAASGAPEIAELAAAIDGLADAYRAQRSETEARVAESNARLKEERNRLAALMSELAAGVLVCNAEGRILLYNEHARGLFMPPSRERAPGAIPLGLGRSVFSFLDREQVAHALEKLRYALEREEREAPVTAFVATAPGGTLVRVRVAPYLSAEGAIAGLVLTLVDATAAFGDQSRRRSLLEALATRLRQPAANVRAAAENLVAFPGMSAEERARFVSIVAVESCQLGDAIDAALREHADALKEGLALEDMRLVDLLNVTRRHVAALPELSCAAPEVDDAVWVRVDSFALVRALASLAERLRDEYSVRQFELRGAAEGGFAQVDLSWRATAVPADALARWEDQPMGAGPHGTALTLRDVLERHGGEAWMAPDAAGGGCVRLLAPLGQPLKPRPALRTAPASRPEYYDFDLFRNTGAALALTPQKLAQLSYTVFDLETTGLEPSAGDRIISIGAVRIVNGRVLAHEVYEQLVDPQRPVSRESVRIHGIRTRDLQGEPTLSEVLPGFHRFCEDTVLVAHNAAFDMRFLELAEAHTGVRFTQPVLDTLLLSAVAQPNQDDHRLEAIAERLGVTVTGRHTALGDALVTSEIFVRLLPLLAHRGVATLGEALEASRQTYYVRLQY